MRPHTDKPLFARIRVWASPPQRTRGRAPSYTRDQVADAAIRVADADGLAAATMRKVAAELGTGAMSLYRYVESKEALVELMSDRVFGEQEWAPLTADWREDLRRMAHGQRTMLLGHPWLLDVWAGNLWIGPNMLRGFERTMGTMDGLGLTIDEMFETMSLLNTWVNGHVRNELETAASLAGISPEEAERSITEPMRELLRGGDYPYFARVLEEASAPHLDAGERFDRALDRILDGIAATLPATGDTEATGEIEDAEAIGE